MKADTCDRCDVHEASLPIANPFLPGRFIGHCEKCCRKSHALRWATDPWGGHASFWCEPCEQAQGAD